MLISYPNQILFVAHGTKERSETNKRKAAHHIFFSTIWHIEIFKEIRGNLIIRSVRMSKLNENLETIQSNPYVLQ